MIFTLNCLISKSLPNHFAGKTEPPGIFEWLLGVAACQKFARLLRLVLRNLAYVVFSLCNALGPSSQADSCTCIRRNTELMKLGRVLLRQQFWSPEGNMANGTGVPRNLLAFCLQASAWKVFVCWEAEIVWSNYTSICADCNRGTHVPEGNVQLINYIYYLLTSLLLFPYFAVQVHLWHAKWFLCFGFETSKRLLIRKKIIVHI